MTHKRLVAAIALFGCAVIISGVIRRLMDSAGQNGLYFGLVMGGVALLGALLAAFNWVLIGRLVAGLSVAVALLWFTYDMYGDLSRKFQIGEPEVRKSVVIVLGAALAVCLCLPLRPTSHGDVPEKKIA